MTSTSVTRREFLCGSAIGGSVVALGGARLAAQAAQPSKPPQSPQRMKLGLYTITFLGCWYRGRGLTMEEMIQRAKQYGYEGIEIEGKRPHGNPLDWPTKRCKETRALAEDQGVPIYGVAALNDFSSPICEHREAQLVCVRDLIRMASDLGADKVRIFLAWSGITRHPQLGNYAIARDVWQYTHKEFTPEQIWDYCRECLIESARYAGDYGVTLALQNHAPVIRTYKDMLRMIQEVNSPHLKACLDPDIEPNGEKEGVLVAAAKDVGNLQVLSHFGGEYDRTADGKITGGDKHFAFVQGMKDIGYTGYIGYELCHPLPKVNGETVGLEFAENNAQLAAEHMRELIRHHYGA